MIVQIGVANLDSNLSIFEKKNVDAQIQYT